MWLYQYHVEVKKWGGRSASYAYAGMYLHAQGGEELIYARSPSFNSPIQKGEDPLEDPGPSRVTV